MSSGGGNKKGSGLGASGGRQPKSHPPSGDFFALGSKSSQGGPRQGSPANIGAPPTKKLHLEEEDGGGDGLFSNPIRISQVRSGDSDIASTSSSKPLGIQHIEVKSAELVQVINEALQANNSSKVVKVLLGSLKQLKNARLKTDPKLNEALTTLGKEKPELFNNPTIIEGLLSVLKKESGAIFKTRSEPATYTLACALLLVALKDSNDWPEGMAKTYIDDALGDRVWIDFKSVKKLTDNIVTLFNSRTVIEGEGSGDIGSTHPLESAELEEMMNNLTGTVSVQQRFSQSVTNSIQTHVVQMVRDQLGKRSGLQPSSDVLLKSNIKFLMTVVGLPGIRLFIAEKFEQWVQNSKMVKPVHDLLLAVAINSHQKSSDNTKVLETLLSAKLKTRLFSQQYISCIKEFININSDNLSTVLHKVVANEISQPVRQPTNIQLLTVICQQWPESAVKILATVFQDFLCRKEDYHRALRGFLREMVRRCEGFPFSVFARGLMQQRNESEFTNLEQGHKERMAISLADLISCTCMLTVTPHIRDAHTCYTKGDKGPVSLLKSFYETLGIIQRDGVWWVHSILPSFLRPQPTDYKTCLRKVLFLEPQESYYSKDNWPSENDRNFILQIMTEGNLTTDTLMRILIVGLNKDLPLSPSDALDITDKLVARAANVHSTELPRIPTLDRWELFNAIFDITAYKPPSSIALPKTYKPPDLAISKLYWKGWLLLLVLAAFNPKTIGGIGWNEYPTLKAMMVMVMTNDYTFPVSLAESQNELLTSQEEQLVHEEKEVILKYENYLALSSSSETTPITESTSYLLNQVMLLDPKGPARKLPTSVIELIKTVNSSLRLGQLLCQCREPDFLLEIIQQQGTSQAMSWLRDLIDGSHSSLDVLPVPCLCEFLITSYQEKKLFRKTSLETSTDSDTSHRSHFKRKQRSKEKILYQHEQMITRLKSLVCSPVTTPTACIDVLVYFINKLTSPTYSLWALKALQDILSPSSGSTNTQPVVDSDDNVSSWLLHSIPSLPVFPSVSSALIKSILTASHTELDIHLFVSYIQFITSYTPQDDIDTGVDVAVLITQRFAFFKKAYLTNIGTVSNNSKWSDIFVGLLVMFKRTLEAHVYNNYETSSVYKEEELTILSLPSISDDCEVLVVSQFIDAIFLIFSLLPSPSSFSQEVSDFFELLLPLGDQSKRAQILAMATREPRPLVKERVFEDIICNTNTDLVSRLVSALNYHQMKRYLSLYGVPVTNMDILLDALDKTDDREKGVLLGRGNVGHLIKIQHVRGCTKGHLFLSDLLKQESDRHHGNNESNVTTNSVQEMEVDNNIISTPLMTVIPQNDNTDRPVQSVLNINDTLSTVMSLDTNIDNTSAVRQLFSYILHAWANPIISDNNMTELVESFLVVLDQFISSLTRSSNTLLENIFKRPFMWRLFHFFTCFIIKRCPSYTQTYRERLLSIKNHTTILLSKSSHVKQIVSSCINIIDSPSTKSGSNKSSSSTFAKGSPPHKIASQMLQLGRHLEGTLIPYVYQSLLDGQHQQLIEILLLKIDIMLKFKSKPYALGLVYDLLQIIDPQLVSVSPNSLYGYLFSSSSGCHTTHLLEKLLHEVSLSTLRVAIVKALCLAPEKNVSSSLILDLLWSSLHLPTLWQGKVKKEAIIDSNLSLGIEDSHTLSLSSTQLYSIIDHIMNILSINNDTVIHLPLLFTCAKKRPTTVAKYIKNHSSSCANQLLLWFYHGEVTVTGPYITHSFIANLSSLQLPSKMDSYLHYLLSSMTALVNNKSEDSMHKLTAASLLCRQLALKHPLMLLRQLPFLGSLLKGFSYSKSLKTQHQLVYSNAFHLLYLLQPVVFYECVDLESCLESIMSYLKYECLNGSLSQSFLSKVLLFLSQYSQRSHSRALKFLTGHFDTLQSLKDAFPKHKKLIQDILSSLPTTSTTTPTNLGGESLLIRGSSRDKETPPLLSSHGGSGQHSYVQVLPFIRKLEFGQTQEEMLQVLKDLEDSSLRSIEILDHFIPTLCRIIQSSDTSCGKIAHEVLLRYLRHNPSSLNDILPSVLSCLNSPDFSVIMTTMPFLPEIILLSPSHVGSLLMSNLFRYAVISPVHCGRELKRVLTLLTAHTVI